MLWHVCSDFVLQIAVVFMFAFKVFNWITTVRKRGGLCHHLESNSIVEKNMTTNLPNRTPGQNVLWGLSTLVPSIFHWTTSFMVQPHRATSLAKILCIFSPGLSCEWKPHVLGLIMWSIFYNGHLDLSATVEPLLFITSRPGPDYKLREVIMQGRFVAQPHMVHWHKISNKGGY